MSLVNILVIAAAVLTILSAAALVFGSSKAERRRSLWFFMASVGEVVWAVSIAGFLSLGTGEFDHRMAPWLIKGIYMGAIWMDVMLLGYVAWKYKYGKVAVAVMAMFALVLTAIFVYDPAVLYTSYELSNTGNVVTYLLPWHGGWYFLAYMAFFGAITPAVCFSIFYQIRHTNNKGVRRGYLFFLIGEILAGFLALMFDLIGPMQRYDLIWVGPLAIGVVMIAFYCAVLKYRIITLSSGWLKAMSAVVLATAVVVAYLLVFHLIFSALFSASVPSFQVILFNFLMIAVVLLLTPAIREIWALMRVLAMTRQIDVTYIVDKLLKLDRRRLNLKEISGFLAEYMHYEFVGFLVNGKYYADEDGKLPAEVVEKIAALPMPTRGTWQDMARAGAEAKAARVARVGVMADANGELIGQVVFGKPTTKTALDREDITRTEMVVNLMETMLENGGRSKS